MENRSINLAVWITILVVGGIFYFGFWPGISLHIWQSSLKTITLTEVTNPQKVSHIKSLDMSNMANSSLTTASYEVRVKSHGFHGFFTPYVDADLYYLPTNDQPLKVLDEVGTLLYEDKSGNAYVDKDGYLYLVSSGIVRGMVGNSSAFEVAEGNYYMASDNQGTYIIPFSDTNTAFQIVF